MVSLLQYLYLVEVLDEYLSEYFVKVKPAASKYFWPYE